jgi:hypothetical protein
MRIERLLTLLDFKFKRHSISTGQCYASKKLSRLHKFNVALFRHVDSSNSFLRTLLVQVFEPNHLWKQMNRFVRLQLDSKVFVEFAFYIFRNHFSWSRKARRYIDISTNFKLTE